MTSVAKLVRKTEIWFDQQIDCIGNYPFETHRIMILLSIVDAFAQGMVEMEGTIRKSLQISSKNTVKSIK